MSRTFKLLLQKDSQVTTTVARFQGGQKPDADKISEKKNMYLEREHLEPREPLFERKRPMNAFRKRTFISKNWVLEDKHRTTTWLGAPMNRSQDRYVVLKFNQSKGAFNVIPVEQWTSFRRTFPQARVKTIEEVEEIMNGTKPKKSDRKQDVSKSNRWSRLQNNVVETKDLAPAAEGGSSKKGARNSTNSSSAQEVLEVKDEYEIDFKEPFQDDEFEDQIDPDNFINSGFESNDDFEEDEDKPEMEKGKEKTGTGVDASSTQGAGSDGPDEGEDDEASLHNFKNGAGTALPRSSSHDKSNFEYISGSRKDLAARLKQKELLRAKEKKKRKRPLTTSSGRKNDAERLAGAKPAKQARKEKLIQESDVRNVFLRYGRTVHGKGLVCEITLKALVKELKKMGKKPRTKEDQLCLKSILERIARMDKMKNTLVLNRPQ